MFWIQGEGLGEEIDPGILARFLGIDAEMGLSYLGRLLADGYLETLGGRYRLSERGRAEGGRIFAEEFADLARLAHGECGPECWCHASLEGAEACAEERRGS